MKHVTQKVLRCLWLWLWLPASVALGQAPTADDYIRPYTGDFEFGANIGYYGNQWSDEALARLGHQAGVRSLRPTLPEEFVLNFGYNIREAAFNTYTNQLGMKELTCFIGGPAPWHTDFTTYPGCKQPSKLFGHLYDPIWLPDGTVNPDNLYAIYVYRLLQVYGDKVRFWEVMNEPDFANGADVGVWLKRAPAPAEQLNTQAPFFHYVRMLRITYEVVKKYHPEAYVSTGGVGYPEYVDALLRYTDEPTSGAVTAEYPRKGGAYFDVLSFHAYPNYALHYWDNSINWFRYRRTSDYSANRVLQYKDDMQAALAKYGYDGTQHPAKLFILTETNVSRRTSDSRIGTDAMQRNFAIKELVQVQKHGVQQFYYYALGETMDAPPVGQTVSGGGELALMGLYENLTTATPATTRLTQAGRAFATTSKLLHGYHYDAARTTTLALPEAIDGAAFTKNDSSIYVLWAKALIDTVERASATYSFPAALNMSRVKRREWDYSATGAQTTQAGGEVVLSTVPAFFSPDDTPPACSASGFITREQWDNVSGVGVSAIPLTMAASRTAPLTQLETTLPDHNYGARVRGYVCAPQTGSYTFWLTGDDAAELWLSTDEDPAHKVQLVSHSLWTSNSRDWYRYPSQQSALVPLVAGRRYYVEVLHKQGWGPGYVSVAWRLPDGTVEGPVSGAHLSPYVAPATPPVPNPPLPDSSACAGTGALTREQWDNVAGAGVSAIPLTTVASRTAPLAQLETTLPDHNYGARVRGYVCAPQTGSYTFWLTGDDAAELWLSPDEDPAHKVQLVSHSLWTSNSRDWYRYPSQQSAAVPLVAGRRYYVEVLHKQGWGPGYVSVAWRLPNGTVEGPIPGKRLLPFVPVAATAATAEAHLLDGSTTAVSALTTTLAAYPNPFTEQTTVQYRVATSAPVSLGIYNVAGQLVRSLYQGPTPAGTEQSLTINRQDLSAGLYFLRLVTGSEVLNQKLMIGE